MPSIQTTKKRLHYSIFRAVVLSQSRSLEKGIPLIGPVLFAHCLVESAKGVFQKHYHKKNLEELSDHLLTFCTSKVRKKPEFETIKVSKAVSEIVGKAYQDIDKIGPEHILYMLMKESEDLRLISAQHEVTMESVVNMINAENCPKESPDVFGDPSQVKPVISQDTKDSPLTKYCVDFTQKAREGLLSQVFCRENEMDQIVTTLLKKNKANPLLIGEPGTGKTSIIEGLAQRFADGNVPSRLKGYRILSMPLSSVVQGTTLRGQFEERLDEILKQVIKDKNVILFIDEMHTIIGAGLGSEAGLDAGNIMKPYLARGDIKCIGATTFDDYYRYMRKDKALSRRFQRIFVSEPDEEKTVEIIKGLVPSLEKFHGCKIEAEVFEYVVRLCKRFVTDRFFPDKAIDCLDHACAKSSLYSSVVDNSIVEQVVSEFSDIPLSLVRKNDVDRMEGMEKELSSVVIGNDRAVSEMCNRIRFCCSTRKSSGVLSSIALYGPPGIGKKTLVYELAERLYGKGAVIAINGAEYSESHSVSKLIGSPPGYVGHEEETFILREVRRKPHTVILIKNQDQMHPSVMEQFKQIFDAGTLTDVHGMIADFSNCIVVFSVDLQRKYNGQIGFSVSDDDVFYDTDFKNMKSKNTLLKSLNYNIGFSDVNRDSLNRIVRLEMDKFEFELKNSGIMVEYEESIFTLFSSYDGTPSEIRSRIRETLELSISEKITRNRKTYRFAVIGNNVKIVEEKEFESSTIQSS